MSISRRAQDIQASPIRKLKPLADEAKKEEFIFSILTLAILIFLLRSQSSKPSMLIMIQFWATGRLRVLTSFVRLLPIIFSAMALS